MLEKIKEKCEAVELSAKITTRKVEYYDGEIEERTELFIQIPIERDFKSIIIDSKNENLNEIVESNFEHYRFIKGFEGIYSADLGVIECEIQSGESLRPSSFINRKLARLMNEESIIYELDEDGDKYISCFSFPSPVENMKILIGDSSTEFSILSGFKRDFMIRRRLRKFQTIRIEGLNIKTHSEANEILAEISNSIFFQIDLIANMPIYLSIDRSLKREIRQRKKEVKNDLQLQIPKYKYDIEAISLYWYARSSVNMPLLQYLAYYQILEFYYPQYSYIEAQNKIKNLLKEPTFDSDNERHIAKVLSIIKSSTKGKSFGDEKSQIKSTLLYCVNPKELKDYLIEDEERKDFLDIKKKSKSLVKQKISFSKSDEELLIDVANRIYELRCRIVHTKDNSESELLLPFSTELAYMKNDIDLIEFIARKVLISSSKIIDLNKYSS